MTDLENREAFEDWFVSNSMHDHVYVRGERMDEKGIYYSEYAYLAWSAWQAAKAQALPEGFVLVPKQPTLKMIHAGEGVRHSKFIVVGNIYKAMIEAQENKG